MNLPQRQIPFIRCQELFTSVHTQMTSWKVLWLINYFKEWWKVLNVKCSLHNEYILDIYTLSCCCHFLTVKWHKKIKRFRSDTFFFLFLVTRKKPFTKIFFSKVNISWCKKLIAKNAQTHTDTRTHARTHTHTRACPWNKKNKTIKIFYKKGWTRLSVKYVYSILFSFFCSSFFMEIT